MSKYILKPLDVIILGEPLPFNSAEQTYRKSSSILNPIPFFACLKKQSKNAKIHFISIIQEGRFLLPVPFDIAEVEGKVKLGKLQKSKKLFLSDSNDEYLITFGEGKLKSIDDRNYVDSNWLEQYLMGEEKYLIDTQGMIKTYRPCDSEYRVGIQINHNTRTAEQGYLYFENYLRFNNTEKTGFYLKTSVGIKDKILNLGGESRVAQIENFSRDIDEEFVNQDKIKEKIKQTGVFKIILLTPTNAPCEIDGAKLVAKIVRRPYIYSGWLRKDSKSFPSRLFRLIKPGAVFYYKIETEDVEGFITKLFEKFWLKPAFFKPDFPYFESIEGINPICLGLTIIGAIEEVENE